jgi:hypothetical protein
VTDKAKQRWPKRRDGTPWWRETEDGCWEWQHPVSEGRYPTMRCGKNSVRAHRFAFEVAFGPISKGADIHHRCGNKLCVNPNHLEMVSRQAHSSRHSRLSPEAVRQIRSEYRPGANRHRPTNLRELAERYGVSDSTVYLTATGALYAWVQ